MGSSRYSEWTSDISWLWPQRYSSPVQPPSPTISPQSASAEPWIARSIEGMILSLTPNNRLQNFHLLFISVVILAFSPGAKSQSAFLEDGILSLPYVLAGEFAYSVELVLIAGSEPIRFELLATLEIPLDDGFLAATYGDNLLFVPDIVVNGVSYWAEFSNGTGDSFTLSNFGLHEEVVSSEDQELNFQPIWQRVVGDATDIGVGADGSVWVIGTDERSGGYGIYHWIGTDWERVHGGGVRIDVDPHGIPWVLNNKHQIHRLVDGIWEQLHGDTRDIGIGADGSVWVTAGGGTYKWNGLGWDRFGGSGVRIDVDPNGLPWIIDHTDDIYQLVGGRWIERPGSARDIGIGADGSVWIIGQRSDSGGHGIYRWTNESWYRVDGSSRQISVGPDGLPWTVSSRGPIFRSY